MPVTTYNPAGNAGWTDKGKTDRGIFGDSFATQLGQSGFSSWRVCYRDLCKLNAGLRPIDPLVGRPRNMRGPDRYRG
jgi:hypothetical protein